MRIVQKTSIDFEDCYDQLTEKQKDSFFKDMLHSDDLWTNALEELAEAEDTELTTVNPQLILRVINNLAEYLVSLDE